MIIILREWPRLSEEIGLLPFAIDVFCSRQEADHRLVRRAKRIVALLFLRLSAARAP